MHAIHYVELEGKGFDLPFKPQVEALRNIKETITGEDGGEIGTTIFLTHRVFTRVSQTRAYRGRV